MTSMLRWALVIPLEAALGLWLGYEAFRAIRTGVANAGGALISVSERPLAFWLVIAVQFGFAASCGLLLLDLLREALVQKV